MNINTLSKVLETAAEEYDPYKGWSSCAQPIAGLSGQDYRALATQALPSFQQRMVDFAEKNQLSIVRIPHEKFMEYEAGKEPFRKWLETFCAQTGQNAGAQVAIVEANVKKEKAVEQKTQSRQEDRARDYMRGMYIVLSGKNKSSHTKSLDRLGDLITALETDEDTVARKNMFHTPKANGYRGAKGLWVVDVAEGNELEGWSVLGEVKIEHEAQQDLNRMTRKFMGVKRSTEGAMPLYFNRCAGPSSEDQRLASSNVGRLDKRTCHLSVLERGAYDYDHSTMGFNRFLSPKKLAEHTPVSNDLLYSQAKKVASAFSTLGSELDGFFAKTRHFGEKLIHAFK